MTETNWTLDSSNGELQIRTGVTGPAAKMGHRLTIAMESWQGTVAWRGKEPTSVELVVDVDSLQVLNGEGGVKPLSGPEKSLARSNALKSLDAKKYPQVRFSAGEVAKTAAGYRLTGTLEIHGKSRPQVIDLAVDDEGDSWGLSTEAPVTQTEFGVKPYSLLMGSMKVADEVIVAFTATRSKR